MTSLEQKMSVFRNLGVEEWIQADFDDLRDFTPERFVRDILRDTLNACRVCCGYNYRFGKDGAGNADTLRELCRPLGIEVIVTAPVVVDGEPVSSTRIRRIIESGQVEKAAKLLGRPFTLDIEVVGGQRLGKLLGSPTINQPLPKNFVRPRFGVYASSLEVGGHVMYGVTNIGLRPTVGSDAPLAETWIADFDGDLYGCRVPVSLVRFWPPKKSRAVEQLQRTNSCRRQTGKI